MERRPSTFSISSQSQLSLYHYKKLGSFGPAAERKDRWNLFKRVNPHSEKVITDGNFMDKLDFPFRFVLNQVM